ncbi:MAG: FKBP-type peptidyl-prolyl cis-trans isomerase [Flavobacteriales bacterium]|nr:FKBP-type peptidyl-prolyl cis-trans isomerase [Flavobacteriales bacterium]
MRTYVPVLFGLLMACGGDGRVPTQQRAVPSADDMLKENRDAVKLEDHDIDLFAKRIGLDLEPTGRGVRYHLLRDVDGPNAMAGQWAKVNYRLELINGDTAYATAAGEPESFLIERDNVESGLHEAIQLMSPGDSALIVIPSYRGHGLAGDQDRIPMRSTLVYRIGLVSVMPDE